MQLPRISLNGTSPERLREQYMIALEKCQDALQSLDMIEVHGRDYILADSNAINVAYKEHLERKTKVRSIVFELSTIIESIDRQT